MPRSSSTTRGAFSRSSSSRKRAGTIVSPNATKGRNNKRASPNATSSPPAQDDDDMSVDTAPANNSSATLLSSTFVTFLSFQVTVSESKKGTATMKQKFQELFSIIKEADSDAALTLYKTTSVYDDNGHPTLIDSKHVIDDPDDIPDSVTAISKYFFGARPNSKGGAIWTQIRLIHGIDIENILADTRDDFTEKKGRLAKQPIQHWDVEPIGFLKNVHPDVDVHNLNEYLSDALSKLNRHTPLLLGLKVKTPWDGKKKTKDFVQKHFRDRIQGVHCECEGAQKSLTVKLLKTILCSSAFQLRYKCDCRLVPPFDRHSSPYIQEKIRRCIVQHGQFCKCVTSNTCEGIQFLDIKNTKVKKTLRQLIIELPDAHFINVDLNWSNTGYAILYPKKYETAAQERIANLGPYLHKAYGNDILPSLPADMQESISEVTWDEATGRPLTKLDRELDDIIECGDNLDYIDLTVLDDVDNRPPAPSNTFIPQLDNESVSTFGTIKTNNNPTASLSRKRSSNTVVSEMTIDTLDSRVSNMEMSFTEMKAMLHVLVARKPDNASMAASPSSINTNAGVSDDASATGV